MSQFLVGLDLGQSQDPTALVVLERVIPTHVVEREQEVDGYLLNVPVREAKPVEYHARHLHRFPLGTSYPEVVRQVKALMASTKLRGEPHYEQWPVTGPDGNIVRYLRRRVDVSPALVVDGTGVGRAVVDMLRQAKLGPVPITIHGGDAVTYDQGWRVPKRDLASTVQVLLQSQRLKIASSLRLAEALTNELLAFRVKISQLTGHDSYGAGTEWRDGGAHDDLVLALACAAWYAERAGAWERSYDPKQWKPIYMGQA